MSVVRFVKITFKLILKKSSSNRKTSWKGKLWGFNYHAKAIEEASFACATFIIVMQVNENELRMRCSNLSLYISKYYWLKSGFLGSILAVYIVWHITSIILTQFLCAWIITTLTDWLLCNVMDVDKGRLRYNTLLGELIYQRHLVPRLIIGLNLYFAFKYGHGHKNGSGKWHFSHQHLFSSHDLHITFTQFVSHNLISQLSKHHA